MHDIIKVNINELLTMGAAATLIGFTERRLRQLDDKGAGPPCYPIMGGKKAYIHSEVLKWKEIRNSKKAKNRQNPT